MLINPTIFQIKALTLAYSISMFLSQQGGYQGLNFGAANGWVRRRTGSTIPVNETNQERQCVTYNGKGALSESNFSFYQNGIEKTTVSSWFQRYVTRQLHWNNKQLKQNL